MSKFVARGTVCASRKITPIPFKEGDSSEGSPEETNPLCRLARKLLLMQGQSYRQQYGYNALLARDVAA